MVELPALMIFERPNPDYDPYAAVYAKYASLVGQLEPLRRRLVGVPFGLDHPYWVADPNFDLDFHIREIHLPRPGMVDQLAEQVSRIVGRPMDRSRPLWEVYVIDGLHSGRWALLTKYHHATIDGAAGQLMLNILTDTDSPTPTRQRRAPAHRGNRSRCQATSTCCAGPWATWQATRCARCGYRPGSCVSSPTPPASTA